MTHRRCAAVVISALLALPALLAAQEPVTITGRVTTDAGVPVGDVEVAIPAMGLGAFSKDDGRYTIVVPGARVAGQTVTLVARRLGYRSMSAQVTLAPGVTQDFSLRANPLQLGEVVVTGAGTLSSTEKLGSVRNSVDSGLIARSGEFNLVQALAGKAPNVTVIQQSGDPGAGSFINIRGISSILGSNQPLIVVDGMPIDNSTFSTSNFNAPDDGGGTLGQFGQTEGTVATNRAADLNPNDIESIEILKGPAASAIYGARAAAGVVLITTKSGRPGATRFTYRSSLSFNDLNRTYPLQRSWSQGRFGVQPDTSLGGTCDDISAATCVRSWGVPIPAGTPVYDHSDDIYRVGQSLENGFTISGGNDRTTFYLSGDYSFQEGVFVGPNNRYSRTAVRVKGTHRVMDNLEIGANVSFADARGRYIQRGNNTNGVQLGNLRSPPEYDNRNYFVNTLSGIQHVTYRFRHPNDATLREDRGFDNPYWVLHEQRNTSAVGHVIGNVSADYLPIPWLRLNYLLGADYANDERLEGCPVGSSSPCNEGRVIDGKIVSYQLNHNLTGTATYRVNPNLAGTVTVGQSLNVRNLRQLGTVGRTMVAVQPFKLSNTVSQDLPIDAEQVIHNASWFGQVTVDLWNQLYLVGAARNDGSSTFGRDNLRTWFPKASAAWDFTKVTADRLSWLSFGKARVAYGEAGQEPLPYLTVQTYSSGLIGGISQGTANTPTQNGIGGLASNLTQAAASLKPERSKEFEAGVDLGLFDDRADASLTWYNKKSEDVILLEPLAPSTGFLQRAANAASFRNQGWEVSLNVRPVQTADYGWDVGFQWARNRNRVLAVGERDFIPVGAQFVNQVAMVGQPLGVGLLIGWVRCGISSDATQVEIDAAGTIGRLDQVCAGQPKGAMYVGSDGFPVADQDPRVLMNPHYNWTGSVRTSFRYRKLQVSGLVDIRNGGQIWNGTKGALWSYGTHRDTEQRAACTSLTSCTGNERTFGHGGWYDGPVAGPGAGDAVSIGENWFRGIAACPFIGIDEPCIEDAGFVKLREISIGYTIEAAWVPRTIGFSSIGLRVTGRNLKTWTDYTGYDPESNLGGPIDAAAGNSGVDYFNNPQTRSFTFAVTLTR